MRKYDEDLKDIESQARLVLYRERNYLYKNEIEELAKLGSAHYMVMVLRNIEIEEIIRQTGDTM